MNDVNYMTDLSDLIVKEQYPTTRLSSTDFVTLLLQEHRDRPKKNPHMLVANLKGPKCDF